MIQEEKELLLRDLSARLPYGVKGIITYNGDKNIFTVVGMYKGILNLSDSEACKVEDFKPYLRPMSSMTEEEAIELSILYGVKDILSIKITDEYIEVEVDDGFCSTEIWTIWYDEIISSIEIFDWLNAHHFDHRGLIEKGLAIEVTEENNPYV